MITNISLHYDLSSNPLEVYKLKNFFRRRDIGFSDGILNSNFQTAEFVSHFTNSYRILLNTLNINLSVPLNNVYLFCYLNGSSNSPMIVQGYENIVNFLNEHF